LPTYEEDIARVQALQQQAGVANQQYAGMMAGAQTFGDRVMNLVQQDQANRGTSVMNTAFGETAGQMAMGGEQIRERLANVNPLQTDVITARQRAADLGAYETLTRQQADITGSAESIIGASTNRLKAMAMQKQIEAEEATNQAEEVMALMEFRNKQEQQKFENWATTRGLEIRQQEANTSGAGGINLEDFFNIPQQASVRATESEPMYSPTKESFSNGGQWYFDTNVRRWRRAEIQATGPNGDIYAFDGINDPDLQKYKSMGYKIETILY